MALADAELRTLRVLVEALLPDDMPAGAPTVDDVARRIDTFLGLAGTSETRIIQTILQIIGSVLPLFPADVPKLRTDLSRTLATEDDTPVRNAAGQLHSLIVLAYYSHPKAGKVTGYVAPVRHPAHHTTLQVTTTPRLDQVYDVAIAGSGPAGALLAARLTAADKSVILLDAGRYVPEETIGTDELNSIARLYLGAGMRATKGEPSVALLQPSCVGGGGVINNGICFAAPDQTLRDWRNNGFPVTDDALWRGYRAVAADLDIGDLGNRAGRLNPAGARLEQVFGQAMPPDITRAPQPGFYRLAVNFERTNGDSGCLSEGLCNHGCGSERKRNSYQVYLKQAALTGCCTIVEQATVENIDVTRRSRHDASVDALRVRLASGHVERVRARQFVLSCGAIGSSTVLLRAEDPNLQAIIATSRPAIPVGARFAGNITSPVIGFANVPVHQETSVQMSHVHVPEGAPGYLLETWFAPPGSMALATPGSFTVHRDRMSRYQRMICLAPLIGTLPTGSVTRGFGGIEVRLPIGPSELGRLRDGTVVSARALLAAGATEVLVRLGNGRMVRNETDLAELATEMGRLGHNTFHLLSLSCAHPQGGNAMSDNPAIGVVDHEFCFRGIHNLRICDGSIFPGAAGVNPQWTIMALAHLCAEELLNS